MKILKLFIIFSLALLLTGCRSKNNDTAHNKRIVLTEAQEKKCKNPNITFKCYGYWITDYNSSAIQS